MGCNGSKSTQVMELGPDGEVVSRKSSASSRKRGAGGITEVTDSNPDGVEVLKSQTLGSTGSLVSQKDTNSQDRMASATSKVSRLTCDSGLESDYGHIITESSHPNMIDDDRPETPDLLISGLKCESRKSSGTQKNRTNQTTAQILGELKSQGIISTALTAPTMAPKKGGTSFDVMIAIDFDELKKPPPRLAKLKRKKKKKNVLTKEEVDAKLAAAEERRKNRQSKLRAKLDTIKKEAQVHQVVETAEETQKKQVEEKIVVGLDQAAKNREAHFKAMKERLEEKKRRAEKVRQAKLARMAEKKANGEDSEEERKKMEEEERAWREQQGSAV